MAAEWLTFALPKGRIMEDSLDLFAQVGLKIPDLSEQGRQLVLEVPQERLRFMAVRATDVPTYVEYGCADIGVVGKDTLLEQEKALYEPLDLRFGYCRLVVAEPARLQAEDDPARWSNIRVATKYPHITESHFAAKGIQVELIKLYGSIELAPLVGLADRIVDLVSTGRTLKENGMVEVETIAEITSRLIVNRASLKTKHARISPFLEALEQYLPQAAKIS